MITQARQYTLIKTHIKFNKILNQTGTFMEIVQRTFQATLRIIEFYNFIIDYTLTRGCQLKIAFLDVLD